LTAAPVAERDADGLVVGGAALEPVGCVDDEGLGPVPDEGVAAEVGVEEDPVPSELVLDGPVVPDEGVAAEVGVEDEPVPLECGLGGPVATDELRLGEPPGNGPSVRVAGLV